MELLREVEAVELVLRWTAPQEIPLQQALTLLSNAVTAGTIPPKIAELVRAQGEAAALVRIASSRASSDELWLLGEARDLHLLVVCVASLRVYEVELRGKVPSYTTTGRHHKPEAQFRKATLALSVESPRRLRVRGGSNGEENSDSLHTEREPGLREPLSGGDIDGAGSPA